jgi:hypothetical protein
MGRSTVRGGKTGDETTILGPIYQPEKAGGDCLERIVNLAGGRLHRELVHDSEFSSEEHGDETREGRPRETRQKDRYQNRREQVTGQAQADAVRLSLQVVF